MAVLLYGMCTVDTPAGRSIKDGADFVSRSVVLIELTTQAATVSVSSSVGQREGGDGGPSGGVPG